MDLTSYLDNLHRDLVAATAAAGEEVKRAAELVAKALDPAARLNMLEALVDAAAEITTKLETAAVEVRLRGREAEFVVTEMEAPAAPPPPPPVGDSGDVARITLRLPEPLKEAVEQAAAAEGISVNAWLVRAIGAAVHGRATPPPTSSRSFGRRVTGFAQA